MNKIYIILLTMVSLQTLALPQMVAADVSVHDMESEWVTSVGTADCIEKQDAVSDGIIIGSINDIVGYYNNDHYEEKESETKQHGIIDVLIHYNNGLLLYEDSTFVSEDFANRSRRLYRTGRWSVRNRTVALYSKIPLIKNKDFVDKADYMLLIHDVLVEDTVVYDIVSPDSPILHDYNGLILTRDRNRKWYVPGDLRWNEYNDRIAILQNAIANDDTAEFIKLYESDDITQYISSGLKEMLVRYAITQRSPNVLMFMNENEFLLPKNSYEHPYKYALRRILYPSTYDLKPKIEGNIEQRNALILEITKNWHQSIVSDETDEEYRINLARSFAKPSVSPLFPNMYQLLIL